MAQEILSIVLPILLGVVVSYVGWKMSRGMQSAWQKAALRAGLIAISITPAIYGHGEISPAIFVVFALPWNEKLFGAVPILTVWILTFFIVLVFGRGDAT